MGFVRTLFYRIAYIIFRAIFSLRYRIKYQGLEEVEQAIKKKGHRDGVLFLPNHPAVVVDPLMIAMPLLAPFHIRALITEYMYYNPLFHRILRFIKALPIPNFAVGVNPIKVDRLQKTLCHVDRGLDEGEAFLIYPSGLTKTGPREIIGGAFATHDLLHRHPKVAVVLVRTVGLWGSRFSRAHSFGNQVDLPSVLPHAFKMLLRNGLFFCPRRTVTIQFSLATTEEEKFPERVYLPVAQGRKEFNRALEQWYNKPFEEQFGPKAGEPLLLVRESRWSDELPYIPPMETEQVDEQVVSSAIRQDLFSKIAELSGKPVDTVHLQDHLVADIGLDSLNIAELIAYIEVQYDQRGINPQEMTTVMKACLYAAGQLQLEKEIFDPMIDTAAWEKPREVKRLYLPEAATLLDAFFETAKRYKKGVIAGDAKSGLVTYKRFCKGVFLLAREIARYEERHIGILLPASVMANILVFATQLAGKVPVMINWTVGGSHLDAVVQSAGLKTVLTSWNFLDRLENVDLSPIKEQIVVLEEAKATFSWCNYLIAAMSSLLPWEWVKKHTNFFPNWSLLSPSSPAVILFTSGTESMPKGVPLTHANILLNVQAALHAIEIFSSDRLLGMLPPFHSFGFTVTGIMPLIAGLRTYYSPNPLDAPRLAHSIRYWKITVACSAPSFLRNILRQSKNEKTFDSLRLAVSGAEKVPDDLLSLVGRTAPHATFVEGYGITECSPVLTLNTRGRSFGVGWPLQNVRLNIVDPEDYTLPRESGTSGMILASGPNIFDGYLQKTLSSPFWYDGAVRWYITGDIGLIDSSGALHITGRLKRFIKVGGEMISLGAVEDTLEKAFKDHLPQWSQEREARLKKTTVTATLLQSMATSSFAVVPRGEEAGRPRLVLFSLFPITVQEANAALRKGGFSNLVRVDAVQRLDEFPLMGTGKISYRSLEQHMA